MTTTELIFSGVLQHLPVTDPEVAITSALTLPQFEQVQRLLAADRITLDPYRADADHYFLPLRSGSAFALVSYLRTEGIAHEVVVRFLRTPPQLRKAA